MEIMDQKSVKWFVKGLTSLGISHYSTNMSVGVVQQAPTLSIDIGVWHKGNPRKE